MDSNTHRKQLKTSILRSLKEMKQIRSKTEAKRWEACAYVYHRAGAFNLGDSKIPEIKLYSVSPVEAFTTLTDGIMGYLFSPTIRWFQFITRGKNFEKSDKIYGAEDYLEAIVDEIRLHMSHGNFYASTKLAIQDVIAQGTSAEMIIDDVEHGEVVYDCISPPEFYIAEDDMRRVNTFYRVYELTAYQAHRKWGDDLPSEILTLIKKGAGHKLCKFLHAIYPREHAYSEHGEVIFSTEKAYASIHYSYTGDEVFRESGFDEFPVAVHRWELTGTSPYGMSPVMKIITEIKKINVMEKHAGTAIDKQVNPAIFVPEALKGRLNLNPGGKNYVNTQQIGKPEMIQTSLDVEALEMKIEKTKESISRLMYTMLFNILMRQDNQRTATEVRAIQGEGLVLLSSIIGNTQEEKVIPIVMRTYMILERMGKLPPPPEALVKASVDGRVQIELSGPLAQNMRAYHQTVGITQGLQGITGVLQLNPNAAINIDFDELIRQTARANGMPEPIIREWIEVKKIKKQMQAQMQAQAEQEQMQAQADAAGKMAHADGQAAQRMAQGVRQP